MSVGTHQKQPLKEMNMAKIVSNAKTQHAEAERYVPSSGKSNITGGRISPLHQSVVSEPIIHEKELVKEAAILPDPLLS